MIRAALLAGAAYGLAFWLAPESVRAHQPMAVSVAVAGAAVVWVAHRALDLTEGLVKIGVELAFLGGLAAFVKLRGF